MMGTHQNRFGSGRKFNSRRLNYRTTVATEIFIRQSSSQLFRATLSDISVSGFKLHSFSSLDPEKLIFVTLQGLQTLGAHIRWGEYQDYGCEFVNSLHPAVLEHLISKLREFGN
ncbi:PilZ domain-containing protein [Parasphingorhabdus halotolerans]|uniref:PilZ domain-containing protein n=1 Tax=Parasphingorhabdus halotolerans TaxID=2725558 RepID=A0A6H2DJC4_9SPHN|nr:PilZ domain-containing protein [Parasphingorhabdus halotolerans]